MEGKKLNIYVASSWRNMLQPKVVDQLRSIGFEVYDFRTCRSYFHWKDVDQDWNFWNLWDIREALKHPAPQAAFEEDFRHMEEADICVLVEPCRGSAHLEAGWFAGQGKPVYVLLSEGVSPEVMFLLATEVFATIGDLMEFLHGRYFQGRRDD